MDQRVHFVTVSTDDLDATTAFYRDGLGWTLAVEVPGEVTFFQVGPGTIFGLYAAARFAADLDRPPTPPAGFTLSHNVDSPDEVDRILAVAVSAGATIVASARQATFGGYHGHFADPNGTVWEIAHNPGWRIEQDGTVVFG